MIGYVTVGTNDLPRAAAFYDALMAQLSAGRYLETDRFIAWASSPNAAAFMIVKPFDGAPAVAGNGNMTALVVDSHAKVDAVYAKAIELGGTCEGKPGARSPEFYAAYFRDLDGNKLNCFCIGAK